MFESGATMLLSSILIGLAITLPSVTCSSEEYLEKQSLWEALVTKGKSVAESLVFNNDSLVEFYGEVLSDKNFEDYEILHDEFSEIEYSSENPARSSRHNPNYFRETVDLLSRDDPYFADRLGDNGNNEDRALKLRQNKYGVKIIEADHYIDTMKNLPSSEQRSLVIVFDGTGSMMDDLKQLSEGAESIIHEIIQREENPIYNYIFVPFRDPYIGPKVVTQNLDKFLNYIKNLPLFGGGDCPESAIAGINLALESALPKSFVFIFTDATAQDVHLDEHTIKHIQEKQVTLTLLLTGFCKAKNSEGYKVYEKLAALSNGQIYNLQKTDIKDVLVGIKASLDTDLIPLTYVYSSDPGSQKLNIPVDKSLREFTVSVTGEWPNITVKDPNETEYKDVNEVLNLSNLKIINVQDPQPGEWNVETEVDSEHSVKLTALSDLHFKFGFSPEIPQSVQNTDIYPVKNTKNVLSILPTDDTLVHNLTSVDIILIEVSSDLKWNISIPLYKIGRDEYFNNSTMYATHPIEPPLSMFKVYVNGFDSYGNPLKQLLSTAIRSISKDIPKITIEKPFVEFVERDETLIECKIETSLPVKVVWVKNNKFFPATKSFNNTYQYQFDGIKVNDAGEYTCLVETEDGSQEGTITVIVKEKIKPMSVKITESNMEAKEGDVDYQISCFVYPKQDVKFSWYFNGDLISEFENNVEIDNDNLIIKNITRTNIGSYTCSVNFNDVIRNDTSHLDVLYEPSIIGPDIEYIEVPFGNDIVLNCSAYGNPEPQVIWNSPQGSKITRKGKITNFELIDEGRYTCRASNGIGQEVDKDFIIKGVARDPPVVKKISNKVNLEQGSPLELICQCENLCNPLTHYFWRKSPFTPASQYDEEIHSKMNNETWEYVLALNNTQVEDSGFYICGLENEHGSDEILVEVEIYELPQILDLEVTNGTKIDLYNIKVIEGANAEILCIATGQPQPDIEWMNSSAFDFNTKNVDRIENDSLILKNVQESDSGTYSCRAFNDFGEEFHQIILQVVVPPKFLLEPEDAIIMAEDGQPVDFYCTDVGGSPLTNIFWKHNSSRMESMDNEFSYKILNVTPEDTGVYECVVENEAGAIARKFVLLVSYEPKIYPLDDENKAVPLGDNVTLLCRSEGYPKPQIVWRFNGEEIIDSEQTLLNTNGDLELKNVDQSNTGVYVCEASNSMGISQKVINLNIQYPPKITSKFPERTKLMPRKSVYFECLAEGNPIPNINWKKNGHILYQNEVETHRLKLKGSDGNQTGTYTCHAENSEGVDEKSIDIVSLDRPRLIRELALAPLTNITEDDNLELICPIEEADVFKWYHNGIEKYETSARILTIENIASDDGGNYTCVGENEAGSKSFTQEVVVWSSPEIFSENTSDGENIIPVNIGDTLTLKCSSAGNPRPKIRWEKDSEIVSIQEDLNLSNIQVYHGGKYTCKAENIFGEDSVSYTIDVLVPPTVDTPHINWLSVHEGEDFELQCSIHGNPRPEITWKKNNYIMGHSGTVLQFFYTSKEDDGTYECEAKSPLGTEKIKFNVDILSPPKFTSEPQAITIYNQELLRLECTAEGNPLPTLVWTFNNRVLISSAKALSDDLRNVSDYYQTLHVDEFGNTWDSSDRYANAIRPSGIQGSIERGNDTISFNMDISDYKSKKSGTYVCYAVNSVGSNELKYDVQVYVPPYLTGREVDKRRSINVNLLEGLPLVLTCPWNGIPKPDISWTHNDHAIYRRPEYTFSRDNKTLTILQTDQTHNGVYLCIAVSIAGEEKKEFFVDILVPPTFNFLPEEGEIPYMHREGKTTLLECPAVGNPAPRIFWTKQLPFDDEYAIEILSENSDSLILEDLTESGVYSCYVNNSLGSIEKKFSVEVLKVPEILDTWPKAISLKEYQTIALYCRTSGTPKPEIRWLKNGVELDERFLRIYFSEDRSVLKIPNAKKDDSGTYVCIAKNPAGNIQKEVNVTISKNAAWSSWEPWTTCSSSCGLGVKIRKRRCLVNSIPATDSNQCSGLSTESDRCEMLPCPVDGRWSAWSQWTSCSKTCFDINDTEKPTRKRYRNCDSPSPAFGGRRCLGSDYEEQDCNTNPCTVDGGWSEWSSWSTCSTSCGKGITERFRKCNNPTPSPGGRKCIGSSIDTKPCYLGLCPVDGGWSEWSSWSECTKTCGEGLRKRFRSCTKPAPKANGKDCLGPSVEISKCQRQACKNANLLNIFDNERTFNPQLEFDVPEPHFPKDYVEQDLEKAESSKYQYATGSQWSSRPAKVEDDVEYYDENEDNVSPLKVVVTFQNYKPIESDLKQITFYPGKAPFTLERFMPCPLGFKLGSDQKCVDVDECKNDNVCHENESCKNYAGGFECICKSGFELNISTKKCEDINECADKKTNECSQICRNSFGSYFCLCQDGYNLSSDLKTCELDVTSEERGTLSDQQQFSSYAPRGCPEGYEYMENMCKDIDECVLMENDCGIDQSCLNTNGSYLCIPTPCTDEYERDDRSGQCVQMCERDIETGKSTCKEGARISQTMSYTLLTLDKLDLTEPILKIVNYDVNRRALHETLFTIEPGKDSRYFNLGSLPFKKGISFLYVTNTVKRERLYNIKVKAKSFDPKTFQLLYVTKFVIYLYIL